MTEIDTRYWPTEKAAQVLGEETGEDRCGICNGPTEETASGAVICRAYGSDHYRVEPPASDSERAAYITGLHQLASILARNPDIPLPTYGQDYSPIRWVITGDEDQREALARIARALPGGIRKDGGDRYFTATGRVAGLYVDVLADRDEVCERVVTGTREVVEEIPDPEVVASAPLVKQTRTEEIVEWQCRPLLADEAGTAVDQ